MASVQSSFLDDLSWLMCTFCGANFTRQKQFLFLFCSKVACIDCALEMRSHVDRSKVNCKWCHKTVGLHQIRDDMPPQMRKMFQNTEKMIDDATRIWEFQQHLSAMALANMAAQAEKMESDIHDMAARTQEDERVAQRNEQEAARYAAEISKVITDERLQQLERFSVEELEQMSFEKMAGSSFRRSSSHSSSRSSSLSLSRHSHEPQPAPGRMNEPTFGLTQMMQGLEFNQQKDAARRNSREVHADVRRHSREEHGMIQRNSRELHADVRRHSREGHGMVRRKSRDGASSRSSSSGDRSSRDHNPQKIGRRQRSYSRHSRDVKPGQRHSHEYR